MKYRLLALFGLGLISAGCGSNDKNETAGAATISTEQFTAHIAMLASDEFEGRQPSSPGEEKTIAYLKDQFAALGLEPGNGNSFFQEVPLVEITTDSNITMTIGNGDATMELAYGTEMMAGTKRVVATTGLDGSEMVFVGYGIVAPEMDWNDYEDLDVAGKTVLILVNDPGFATQDPELFNGNAMTYYGRWTYKYEEAARQGAAGAIIVHETKAAGYPWEVVSGSWSGPQFDLVAEDKNMSRVAVEGWITMDVAKRVFSAAGLDYETQKAHASTPEFKAVGLGQNATVTLQNKVRQSVSNNVIATLRGSMRPDETIFYVAHWDHLGKDDALEGDQIYNGAVDNATGTAALLEIARAFTTLETPPERSIVFLAVTAEESGLLGSAYYGTNPVYPLATTVAALNIDAMNIIGRTKNITVIGYGSSELEEYLETAAKAQGRHLEREPTPEKGYFYRSDHFNFSKRGGASRRDN